MGNIKEKGDLVLFCCRFSVLRGCLALSYGCSVVGSAVLEAATLPCCVAVGRLIRAPKLSCMLTRPRQSVSSEQQYRPSTLHLVLVPWLGVCLNRDAISFEAGIYLSIATQHPER